MTDKLKYTERFIKFWQLYPEDLSHSKKGSKFNALKAFLKYSEDEQDRIIFDTEALIRYDRQDPKPDRWPHASTYLNQRYFDREITTIVDLKEKIQLKQCRIESCENEVHGPKYDLCTDCLLREKEIWRNPRFHALRDLNLVQEGDKYGDVIRKCKERGSLNGKFSLTHLLKISRMHLNDQQENLNQSKTLPEESTTKEEFNRDWFEAHGWKKLDYDR